MFGFRLVPRAAFPAVFTVILFSSVAAKAQGVCNFLSGSQKAACHNAAVAVANQKAADAQKAKAAATQPVTVTTGAAPDVGSGSAAITAPESAGVVVPVAQQTASARTQSCNGLQVNLVSLVRTGPGDVTASFLLLNTKNDDMATFVYYGGANGKNTFLVDDSGTEWPKKRVDGNGNHRQALIAGVNTKYQLVFHVATGGQDARTFQVITYFQLLPLSGMGEFGWCNIKFSNVPLSAPAEAQALPPAPPQQASQAIGAQRQSSAPNAQVAPSNRSPVADLNHATSKDSLWSTPAGGQVLDCAYSYSGISTFDKACTAMKQSNQANAATALFKQSCDEGALSGCRYLAEQYRDAIKKPGSVVPVDLEKANQLSAQACAGGETNACEDLAHMYENGKLVGKDMAKADEFYEKSCRMRIGPRFNAQACVKVGDWDAMEAHNQELYDYCLKNGVVKSACSLKPVDRDCPIGVRLRVTGSDGSMKVICRRDAWTHDENEVKATDAEMATMKRDKAADDAQEARFRKDPTKCMIHHTYTTGSHKECPNGARECRVFESFSVDDHNTVAVNQCPFTVTVRSSTGLRTFESQEYGPDFEFGLIQIPK